MRKRQPGLHARLATLLAALVLAACGGGGGGDAPPGGGTGLAAPAADPPPAGAEVVSAVEVACVDCAATDHDSYAGAGVGVWSKTNVGSTSLDVPVKISGLSGQDVALVFTNETAAAVALPAINMSSTAPPQMQSQLFAAPPDDPHARIRSFNREGWAERIAQAPRGNAMVRSLKSGAPQAAIVGVGASRGFHHEDGSQRTATLQRQVKSGDGTVVNVWLENGEAGTAKVTPAMLDRLADSFARAGGIHDMLRSMGGPLWGAHGYTELIPGAGQPIEIVLLNFDRNAQPFGMMGYFWALHALRKEVDARSNEAVSMYLDTETMYLGGENALKMAQMTLAHEGMHMSNFYRRGVSMGPSYQYETWLEEMTALMMEDAASSAIDASYNPIRDTRLRDYLRYGSYNCALKNWTPFAGNCESYSVSGSFGGFLLRHLGVGFMKDLLQQRQASSQLALEAAIQAARPGSGMGLQLRNFAASAIGTLPASAPAGFGFPARTEAGFDIPAIDASRHAAARKLPLTAPSSVAAYANFPVVRSAVTGTFSEVVRVPPGTTLSVVIR